MNSPDAGESLHVPLEIDGANPSIVANMRMIPTENTALETRHATSMEMVALFCWLRASDRATHERRTRGRASQGRSYSASQD